MDQTPKKKTSLKAIGEHEQEVLEMWQKYSTIQEIYDFLVDKGVTHSYDQIRKTLKLHYCFDPRRPGRFLDQEPKNIRAKQPEENNSSAKTSKFEYDPKAPNVKDFW